jgi:hypothetical protein
MYVTMSKVCVFVSPPVFNAFLRTLDRCAKVRQARMYNHVVAASPKEQH